MSKSYHVTSKDLKEFTKKEIDEMAHDNHSLLNQYAEKSKIKKVVKKERKSSKKK